MTNLYLIKICSCKENGFKNLIAISSLFVIEKFKLRKIEQELDGIS